MNTSWWGCSNVAVVVSRSYKSTKTPKTSIISLVEKRGLQSRHPALVHEYIYAQIQNSREQTTAPHICTKLTTWKLGLPWHSRILPKATPRPTLGQWGNYDLCHITREGHASSKSHWFAWIRRWCDSTRPLGMMTAFRRHSKSGAKSLRGSTRPVLSNPTPKEHSLQFRKLGRLYTYSSKKRNMIEFYRVLWDRLLLQFDHIRIHYSCNWKA